MFSRLKTVFPATVTSCEIEDSETLTIDADLLDLLDHGQYVMSAKRPVPKCKNLSWWITCYPNGNETDNEGYLSVYVYTSMGGFEKTMTVTLLRSDIKVDVRFKIPQEMVQNEEKIEEDNYVIKFNRTTIKTIKTGEGIVEGKRSFHGVNWWIQYYPAGYTYESKQYVSVFIFVDGGPKKLIIRGAISINGVAIYNDYNPDVFHNNGVGYLKLFSHKQCKLADHINDIVDIEFKVSVRKTDVIFTAIPSHKTSVKDQLTVTFDEYELDRNHDFEGTLKTAVKDSEKHRWWLQYFPAGDCARSKGHISLFIKASTSETKMVILSCVIRIVGTNFEKKFNMLIESDSYINFPKLISHEELKLIGGIVDSKITITCEAVFTTHDIPSLNL
uniref:MATH domain-containing protein n=2 Tax=Panagrellus redivivus TaxID=6233 RepID=A0A7E4V4V2_PANRE